MHLHEQSQVWDTCPSLFSIFMLFISLANQGLITFSSKNNIRLDNPNTGHQYPQSSLNS